MNVCMLHSRTYCHNALVTLIKGSTTWHSTTTFLVKCTQMFILYCPRLMPTTNLTVLWFCKILCVIAHHAKSFLGDRTEYFTYCCWANIHSSTFKVQKFSGKPYKMCIQEKKNTTIKLKVSLEARMLLVCSMPTTSSSKGSHTPGHTYYMLSVAFCSYSHNWQMLLRLGNEDVGQFLSYYVKLFFTAELVSFGWKQSMGEAMIHTTLNWGILQGDHSIFKAPP